MSLKFLGFDFKSLDTPYDLSYTPQGWSDRLTVSVARSTAQARTKLLRSDGPAVKQLTPMALESRTTLPASLPSSQVITSLVSEAGDVPKTTSATQLPEVLSQRAHVLDYGGMGNAMCAGFMIATFNYDFASAPVTPTGGTPDYEGIKRTSAQDVVVGTAFNLAKKKLGNGTKETVLHTKQENLDQVHTEQLLCGQIDAFMGLLSGSAARAEVINVHERWEYKKDGFDLKKITVKVKIVFEHTDKNVGVDCPACSKTIKETSDKWSPKCKGFTIAVSKNS